MYGREAVVTQRILSLNLIECTVVEKWSGSISAAIILKKVMLTCTDIIFCTGWRSFVVSEKLEGEFQAKQAQGQEVRKYFTTFLIIVPCSMFHRKNRACFSFRVNLHGSFVWFQGPFASVPGQKHDEPSSEFCIIHGKKPWLINNV